MGSAYSISPIACVALEAQPDIRGLHPLQCVMSRPAPLSYKFPVLLQ